MDDDDPIRKRLTSRTYHMCAKCLAAPSLVYVGGRESRATFLWARCHGRVTRQLVHDVDVEDKARLWWFLDDDGEPYVPSARRTLLAELEAERARRLLGATAKPDDKTEDLK